MMELVIDQFTQCLVDMQTGNTVDTAFSKASPQYLQTLTGWAFDWCGSDLESAEIYKLSVSGSTEAEGLVALQYMERDHAVYVQLAESAPHNRGASKRYGGVGGHLFAIAAQKSLEAGYGGFFFMDAKNIELVRHYQETLGAIWIGMAHEYRMLVEEDAAAKLVAVYTLKEATE